MSCDPSKLIAEPERELLRRCSQPRWTSPMLATLTDERFSDEDWIFERKLDGERALVFRSGGNTRLMTRNRKTIREACEKGWEGVIAKDATSEYVHSRSRSWLKFKCTASQELVIGGFTEPKSSREGFGALLVGYYDDDKLRYAGKVGTGYDDEFLQGFRRRLERAKRKTSPFSGEHPDADEITWVTPEFVGEFGFTEWTSAGKLRHPRFLGLRRDKDPRKVVRESPRQAS